MANQVTRDSPVVIMRLFVFDSTRSYTRHTTYMGYIGIYMYIRDALQLICQQFCLREAVIFNRGSAEPKGSARTCQGFRGWSVKR